MITWKSTKTLKSFLHLQIQSFQTFCKTSLNYKSQKAIDFRSLSAENNVLNAQVRTVKVNSNSNSQRSNKILQHFSSNKCVLDVVKLLPDELFKYKKKILNLYLVDEFVAETIVSIFTKAVSVKSDYVIEVNPGPGLITKKLLDQNYRLIIFESNEVFSSQLVKMKSKYPNLLQVKANDFLQQSKLKFLDFQDGGSRLSNLFQYLERKSWNGDTTKMILAFTVDSFLRHLVYECYVKSGFSTYGRPEMYCLLSPSLFRKLTAAPNKDKMFYRSFVVLFSHVFDIELLHQFPRQSFLPWSISKRLKTASKFHQELQQEDKMHIYLVKIEGKKNFYNEAGNQDHASLFISFVHQFFKTPNGQIISNLEKFFPGCGPKLIASGIGVFTLFSDLTPEKIFQLFLLCSSFPNFEDSSLFSGNAKSILLDNSLYNSPSSGEPITKD